jgi:hypothetical protein
MCVSDGGVAREQQQQGRTLACAVAEKLGDGVADFEVLATQEDQEAG